MLLITTFLVAIGSAIGVRVARHFGVKRALLDLPNERSSHQNPVPRLGGAAVVPMLAGGLWIVWPAAFPLFLKAAFFGGMVVLYTIGLWDDLRPLPGSVRFAVQFAVAFGLLAAACNTCARTSDLRLLTSEFFIGYWQLSIPIVLLINLYNFMDGIDGIAGVQGVVAGLGWMVLGHLAELPVASSIGILIAAASVGFLTLNWPPAKIFMGDAGSTVLGFIFAVLPLIAISSRTPDLRNSGIPEFQNSRMLIAGGLIVFPFVIDGMFTICRRLSRRENIFKAHRSHVYQRLVLSGLSHQTVTLVYGALALVGAAAGIAVVVGPLALGGVLMVACLLAFGALWRWAVCREVRAELNRGGS